jgi:PTH1 family peptidyl-tRNA hydrolase
LRLICGLGNPETRYTTTRHNIGERVVCFLASASNASLKEERKFFGKAAKIEVGQEEVILLFPTTYMNESGRSVGACSRFFRIAPEHILVVADDVHLPFGKLRLREKGSHGGHNGLRSVEAHIGTNAYPRLKIGIGAKREGQELSDHVLGHFVEEERKLLPSLIQEAAEIAKNWVVMPIEKIMNESSKQVKERKPDLLQETLSKEDKEKKNDS